MNIIKIDPLTRINDRFIRTDRINATPVLQDVVHALITSDRDPTTMITTKVAAQWYTHIALDIVTESVFNYPYPYVTEKTLRPINCKRMFVIVGAAHTLELLHRKGIVTFDNILDESYDSIEDPEARFLAVVNTIENFCTLDLGTIQQYYQDNRWRFDQNWHTLKNLSAQEIDHYNRLL